MAPISAVPIALGWQQKAFSGMNWNCLFTIFIRGLRDGLRRQMLNCLTENRHKVTRNSISVTDMALISITYWNVFLVCIKKLAQ
jgi:hypothetical protein